MQDIRLDRKMNKKVDRGEFFPYINGKYVNPYAKKEKNPTIIKGGKRWKEMQKTKSLR